MKTIGMARQAGGLRIVMTPLGDVDLERKIV
jgi:hypothetical protein